MWLEAALSSDRFRKIVKDEVPTREVDVTDLEPLPALPAGSKVILRFTPEDVKLRTLSWEERELHKGDGGVTIGKVDNLGVDVHLRMALVVSSAIASVPPRDLGRVTTTYLVSPFVKGPFVVELSPKYRDFTWQTSDTAAEVLKPRVKQELEKNVAPATSVDVRAFVDALGLDPSAHPLVNAGVNPRPYGSGAWIDRVALLLEFQPRPAYPFSSWMRAGEPSGTGMERSSLEAPPLLSGDVSVTVWYGALERLVREKLVEAAGQAGVTVTEITALDWSSVAQPGEAGVAADPPALGPHSAWTPHGVRGTFEGTTTVNDVADVEVTVSFTVSFSVHLTSCDLLAKVVWEVVEADVSTSDMVAIAAKNLWDAFWDVLTPDDDEAPPPVPSATKIGDNGLVMHLPLDIETEFGAFRAERATTGIRRADISIGSRFVETDPATFSELSGRVRGGRKPPPELDGYLTIGGRLD